MMSDRVAGVWLKFFCVSIYLVGTAASCSPGAQHTVSQKLSAAGMFSIHSKTSQQLADEGERLIFGEREKRRESRAIGKAQCPVCHAFLSEQSSERAPNLWGIASRKRIKPTPIEYLAESHTCPSCYVVAGWGVTGSQGCESPMPKVHLPPINLTIQELVAVDTWMYVHEGETPPSPQVIRDAYKDSLSIEEWRYVTRDTRNSYGTETSVKQLFLQHACAACHIIPGVPGATGKMGPQLNLKTRAAQRLQDPAYQGNASSPREYIAESILYHDIYVVADEWIYAQNTLPSSTYRNSIQSSDLNQMVEYLAQLEEDTHLESHDESGAGNCLQNRKS